MDSEKSFEWGIIGAGIAGASAAYSLAKRGKSVVVFEANSKKMLAEKTNQAAALHPRIEAQRNEISAFYLNALEYAIHNLQELEAIHQVKLFWPAGHLIKPKSQYDSDRFAKICSIFGEHGIHMQDDALFIKNSGYVQPHLWRQYLLLHRNIATYFATRISRIEYTNNAYTLFFDSNAVTKCHNLLLAAGHESQALPQMHIYQIYMDVVAGMISYFPQTSDSQRLQHILSTGEGGYIIPTINGLHAVGSIYERNFNDLDAFRKKALEHNLNIWKSQFNLTTPLQNLKHNIGYRLFGKNRMPIIGAIPGYKNLYVSTGHGSRGMLSGPWAGEIIARELS